MKVSDPPRRIELLFSIFMVLPILWAETGCVDDNASYQTGAAASQHGGLSETTFALHSTTDVGKAPHSLAAADFDGDGVMDMAVANKDDGTVSILMGYGMDHRGLGIYEQSEVYPTDPEPFDVTTADLDNDGRIDILTANKNGPSVTILWGQGDGTFPESREIVINSSSATPTQVVSADFNGDGISDIATSNGEESSVAFIRGIGNRAYAAPKRIALGLPRAEPAALTAADFNGDGQLDVAVADWGVGKVSVLLLDPEGGVLSRQHVVAGRKQLDIAAADIDHDGVLDLVTTSVADDAVYFLKGEGDGAFQPGVAIDVGHAPVSVTPSDMDQNGILDLVVTERDDATVTVLFGDAGNAQGGVSFTGRATAWVGKKPMDAVVFDATGDDISDIAVVNRNNGTVDVLRAVTQGCTGSGCADVVPEMCAAPDLTRVYRRQWTRARVAVAKIWDAKVDDCDRGDEFADRVIERIGEMADRLDEISDDEEDGCPSVEKKSCRILGRIDGALVGLDLVQAYCGLYCFLSGDVVGTIAAETYCDLAIETNGAIDADAWVRQPINICGLNFEIACDTTFLVDTMSYVNALGDCQPYTTGDYFDTWDNTRSKSCDYNLNH